MNRSRRQKPYWTGCAIESSVAIGALLCGPTVIADAGLAAAAITNNALASIADLQTILSILQLGCPLPRLQDIRSYLTKR